MRCHIHALAILSGKKHFSYVELPSARKSLPLHFSTIAFCKAYIVLQLDLTYRLCSQTGKKEVDVEDPSEYLVLTHTSLCPPPPPAHTDNSMSIIIVIVIAVVYGARREERLT